MSRGEAVRLAAGTLVLLVLAVFVAARLAVTTDITHFLPGGELSREVALARQLATSELSRTMVLLVEAADTEMAVAASQELAAALRAEPRVAAAIEFLDAGPPAGIEEAMWQLYQPRRLAFMAVDPADVPALLAPAGLAAAATRLKQQLRLPLSSMLSRVAPGDPFLVLPRLYERLAGGRSEGLVIEDGCFLGEDGRSAVLFLGTRAPSSDAPLQRPVLAGIRAAFDQVNARHGGRLRLMQSGANRFAVHAESTIKADIDRVTVGSIVGLALVFLLMFRSLRIVLLTLPVLTAGFLAGTAACLLLFGKVHGLTLAFGASLIGVSVDYSVQFHCHQTVAPHPLGHRHTLSRIWTGLWLGAATTVVGFIALVVSSFPGLRELAWFAACGITAALFATSVFLPGLSGNTRPTAIAWWLVGAIRRITDLGGRRRLLLAVPIVAVLLLMAVGLPLTRWDDAITNLNRLDPALLAEDQSVRDRVVRYEQRRLVIATGDAEERALAVNDRVAAALDAAQQAGELAGWRSAATLLPSVARQRAVDAAVRGDATLWPRLRASLADAGFVVDGFLPFAAALTTAAPAPLSWSDLVATPMASLVRPFRVTIDGGVGMVSFLNDLHDEAALRRRLAKIDGARLIDIESILTTAYAAYRQDMTILLLLGLVAVIALVAVRHRAVRPTFEACAPALLAAAGTVAVLALAGVALNILSLVALLMIVSMGADYGIFLVEAQGSSKAIDATNLAVCLAGTTTILGFGLLAFSDQPALFSIGLTSGVGILLSLVLAYATSALAAGARRPRP